MVEKGDDIIVELPGDPNSPAVVETEELIARTAKLEMKVVDDCFNPPPTGCTKDGNHTGSAYMLNLFRHVGSDKKDEATDPEARRLEIQAPDRSLQGRGRWRDPHRLLPQRAGPRGTGPVAWAKKHSKLTKDSKIQGDMVTVNHRARDHRPLPVRRQGPQLPGPDREGPHRQGPRRSPARLRAGRSAPPTPRTAASTGARTTSSARSGSPARRSPTRRRRTTRPRTARSCRSSSTASAAGSSAT